MRKIALIPFPGIRNNLDDTLAFGKTTDEHDCNLQEFMEGAYQNNIKYN